MVESAVDKMLSLLGENILFGTLINVLVEQSVSAWTAPTARSETHRSPIGSCGFTVVFGEILLPLLLWDKGLAECGPNFVLCRPFEYQVS